MYILCSIAAEAGWRMNLCEKSQEQDSFHIVCLEPACHSSSELMLLQEEERAVAIAASKTRRSIAKSIGVYKHA